MKSISCMMWTQTTTTKPHALHIFTQTSACAQTHAQTHTHTHTPPSSGFLDILCLTSCWETEALTHNARLRQHCQAASRSSSQSCSQPASQPEGYDIGAEDPEEVDNSTASGMLGPEGRNKNQNPASSEEAERWAADSRGDRLMALPHVDTVDTSKHRSFQTECVFTDMGLLSENTPFRNPFQSPWAAHWLCLELFLSSSEEWIHSVVYGNSGSLTEALPDIYTYHLFGEKQIEKHWSVITTLLIYCRCFPSSTDMKACHSIWPLLLKKWLILEILSVRSAAQTQTNYEMLLRPCMSEIKSVEKNAT